MMPPLNTPVPVPPMDLRLGFDSGVVSMGSCFADEVGQRLQQGGFEMELNPFGTLYNPASVASALERLVDDREVTDADLVQHEGHAPNRAKRPWSPCFLANTRHPRVVETSAFLQNTGRPPTD